MIEPKVGQVWEHKENKTKEIIVTIDEGKYIHTNKGTRSREGFIKYLTFNKEETLKHLKEQQELINQQIEELNKPEIVKHKFEVVVYAPENYNSNNIFNALNSTLSTYWEDCVIESYSVDVIKDENNV